MNRKIFTLLLAGAFLMLATVFSVNAQRPPSAITKMGLKLGEPVEKLNLGANDYYYLRVAAYYDGTAKVPSTAGQDTVLYMGSPLGADKNFPVFLAPIGKAGFAGTTAPAPVVPPTWLQDPANTGVAGWFPGSVPKTYESASALWCTVVNNFDQGQNITFDFTNKQQKNQMLEVEISGNSKWANIDGYRTTDQYDLFTPGIISGWNFSATYATMVQPERPLFSYISMDTAVVICIDTATNLMQDIYLKIASVDDILAGIVPGMLYFTLHEAAPFALDADDFNSLLGSNTKNLTDKKNVSLIFSPDADPAKNPFTQPVTSKGGALWAAHIAYDGTGNNTYPTGVYNWITNQTALFDADGYPINDVAQIQSRVMEAANQFDNMGYMYLRSSSEADAEYLYVKHAYYDDNRGGDQFLDFGFRQIWSANITDPDTLELYDALYPQTIWRLIYYPSGDSIYINPFQATYLPTHNNRRMTTSSTSPDRPGERLTWTDSLVQTTDFYTFRAITDNLDIAGSTDPYDIMTGRLKYGKDALYAADGDAFYSYYHRNYVTIQNLTGSVKIVTLGNGNFEVNHKIDTWINAGVYNECLPGGSTERVTVASDLYLIRSNDGKYFLRIPLHSATDSAEWWMPEPDERPELMPSYQWVVMKRYENSGSSQITIYNREFDGTKFEFIQLTSTAMSKFNISSGDFRWNNKAVNHRATDLATYKSNSNTFIALPASIKKDTYLGYEYIPRDQAQINVYALNFSHEYDQSRYVDWKGDFWKYPTTDTTVYVTAQGHYDRLYFKLDTALNYSKLEPYGFDPKAAKYSYKIPDLVQLQRQPYFLNFEDPYKLLCTNSFSLINGTQGEYAMGRYENVNKSFLGTPIFNLRHTYFKTDEDGKTIPYFALVQRINEVSYDPQRGGSPSAFKAWLEKNFAQYIADKVMEQISINKGHTKNDYFKTGVFVAGVENQSAKLKAMLRADEATTVSTFRLVQDDDPIYRRFNTLLEADVADDTPKTLDFIWMDRPSYKMFENTGELAGQKAYWENYGIGTVKTEGKKNYLGYVNINQYQNANTAIYVDTAFINRGTGHVKPQYMLVVDPSWPDKTQVCDDDGNFYDVYENYLRGRFLINATDSARGVGSGINNASVRATGNVNDATTHDKNGLPIGRSYLWENNWERLIFTDAIHSYEKDALYLVNGVNLKSYMYEGSDIIDIQKLDAASTDTLAVSATKPIRKIRLGNNFHKDAVFQMRLIERGSVEFIIESETGEAFDNNTLTNNPNRIWGTSWGQLNSKGLMIAPCAGAWIKEQGGTAVVSRSNVIDNLANGLRMDVKKTEAWPTANETVIAAAPTVIGGNNAITILGAAGKKVVISNVLGQTVAGTVITSDNATLSAPKGVVVVAIEGEAAVKTLVK